MTGKRYKETFPNLVIFLDLVATTWVCSLSENSSGYIFDCARFCTLIKSRLKKNYISAIKLNLFLINPLLILILSLSS